MRTPESDFWATIRMTEAERDEARAERDRLRVIQQAITECRDDPAGAIVRADRIAGEALIRAHLAEEALARIESLVEDACKTVHGRLGLADDLRSILASRTERDAS